MEIFTFARDNYRPESETQVATTDELFKQVGTLGNYLGLRTISPEQWQAEAVKSSIQARALKAQEVMTSNPDFKFSYSTFSNYAGYYDYFNKGLFAESVPFFAIAFRYADHASKEQTTFAMNMLEGARRVWDSLKTNHPTSFTNWQVFLEDGDLAAAKQLVREKRAQLTFKSSFTDLSEEERTARWTNPTEKFLVQVAEVDRYSNPLFA